MWRRIQHLIVLLAVVVGIQGGVLVAHPAAQNDDGPGYCWDHYVMEAVAAFDEWDDCHDNVAWYDIGGFITCDIVYEARAIGAAMWWAKCVGMPGRNA